MNGQASTTPAAYPSRSMAPPRTDANRHAAILAAGGGIRRASAARAGSDRGSLRQLPGRSRSGRIGPRLAAAGTAVWRAQPGPPPGGPVASSAKVIVDTATSSGRLPTTAGSSQSTTVEVSINPVLGIYSTGSTIRSRSSRNVAASRWLLRAATATSSAWRTNLRRVLASGHRLRDGGAVTCHNEALAGHDGSDDRRIWVPQLFGRRRWPAANTAPRRRSYARCHRWRAGRAARRAGP